MKARLTESDVRARSYRWRSLLVLTLVMGGSLGLVARAIQLQLVQSAALKSAATVKRCAW